MSEHQDEQRKKPRLNLTTSQVAASALAACCASIVASYLGVAGTVIGAAVGSVVATTGAAIWGHLFRTGGKKLKQTLLVDGEPVEVDVDVERADVDAASPASVPAGRFYGTEASTATAATAAFEAAELWHPKTPTAETQVITDKTKAEIGSSSLTSRINPRIKKYGKPVSIVVAIVAVFCISIVVGIFAGAPVRSAGSTQSPATTTTTTVTQTERTQGQTGGSSASAGSSASSGSGGSSSASPSSSSSAAASSSAGSTASPSASSAATAGGAATGQGQAGATSTGSAAP
jgi:hypothetical protein